MPVWHEQIKKLNSESLAVIGVVQEQHAERTRLYKQWKQYDFPIAQDPFTKLGMTGVPLFVGIDENGIVRKPKMRPSDLAAFIEEDFAAPKTKTQSKTQPQQPGDQQLLFSKDRRQGINTAIERYTAALKDDPNNGPVLFRLGVAYRMRYDEFSRADADFDAASKYWTLALASNPNQYIWRRRIEQYGPRMQKPYPFYDWVGQAKKEIIARGDTPVELSVALTKSELAGRSRLPAVGSKTNPDPNGRIARDMGEFVTIHETIVPAFIKPGKSGTAHLVLTLNDPSKAKWNNEATPLEIWIESDDAELSTSTHLVASPQQSSSSEKRRLEFDVAVKKGSDQCLIKGFALYHICLDDGVCTYRRQDFQFSVPSVLSR